MFENLKQFLDDVEKKFSNVEDVIEDFKNQQVMVEHLTAKEFYTNIKNTMTKTMNFSKDTFVTEQNYYIKEDRLMNRNTKDFFYEKRVDLGKDLNDFFYLLVADEFLNEYNKLENTNLKSALINVFDIMWIKENKEVLLLNDRIKRTIKIPLYLLINNPVRKFLKHFDILEISIKQKTSNLNILSFDSNSTRIELSNFRNGSLEIKDSNISVSCFATMLFKEYMDSKYVDLCMDFLFKDEDLAEKWIHEVVNDLESVPRIENPNDKTKYIRFFYFDKELDVTNNEEFINFSFKDVSMEKKKELIKYILTRYNEIERYLNLQEDKFLMFKSLFLEDYRRDFWKDIETPVIEKLFSVQLEKYLKG